MYNVYILVNDMILFEQCDERVINVFELNLGVVF